MKFVIVGAGGIGATIGGYLAHSGKDVTLIARGAQLKALNENGLLLRSAIKGELKIENIKALAPDSDADVKGDVIFLCVKGYSLDSSIETIKKYASENTIVIPIINSITAADKLRSMLPGIDVLGGCIYTSSFVTEPGVAEHPTSMIRIIFGPKNDGFAKLDLLNKIADELEQSGIKAVVSDNIERDNFRKFMFISSFAATDSYYDVDVGALQKPGEPRELFISLLKELAMLASAKQVFFDDDAVTEIIKLLDGLEPAITSSMHKDVIAGKEIEKKDLIFDVFEEGKKYGLNLTNYEMIAKHFGYSL